METLLAVGLWNAVGAMALAVVAASVGRVCRRPAIMHALWLLVLLKLITPPLWSVAIPVSNTQPTTAAEIERPMPALIFGQPATAEIAEEVPQSAPEQVPLLDFPSAIQGLPDFSPEADAAAPPVWNWPWMDTILAVWAAGAILCWSLSALRVARFHRMLRRLCPAPHELQARVNRLAAKLGLRRSPVVYLVAAPISPMVWALTGRARLLVPQSLWDCLSDAQRDLMLVHELAHLRRRDQLVRLLELVVVGFYWWFPVAWLARRRLQEAAELCCDAWVVATFPEAGEDYAATLVESASFLSHIAVPVPVGASGLGPVPLLRRRITMILNDKIPARLSWTAMVLVLATAAALLPLWPTRADLPEAVGDEAERKIAELDERALSSSPEKEPGPMAKDLPGLPQQGTASSKVNQSAVVLETKFGRLEYDLLDYDLGYLEPSDIVSANFAVQNISKHEKVTIGPIRLTTGAAKCTVEKAILEPNESTPGSFSIDTKRYKGPKPLLAYVSIRQGDKQATVVLQLSVDGHDDAIAPELTPHLKLRPVVIRQNGPPKPTLSQATPPPQGVPAPVVFNSDPLAPYRDDIELLKVKCQIEAARLALAEAELTAAVQRYKLNEKLATEGAVNASAVLSAKQEVESRIAEVKVQKAQLQHAEAQSDLNIARFWERTGHPGSARFYYQIVQRRYPGTNEADEAAKQMIELEAKAASKAKPVQPPKMVPPPPDKNASPPQASVQPPPAPQSDDPRVLDIQKKIAAKIRELDTLRSLLKNIMDTAPKDKQSKAGPPLSVNPTMVELGQVKVGNPVEFKVKVNVPAGSRYKGLQGTLGELFASAVDRTWEDSHETAWLTMTFEPYALGDFKRTLRVLTQGGNETVEFTVVAQVIQ